ncbi:MAG TPA: L-rhamnose/proton symporter RhaT [Terracidiphilus sp.]|nr:L-rhamnose/proton symporter RhaT [Terracidiphilus sp.]
MPNIVFAVGLIIIAGALNGSFAAPTKYARQWKWENIWSVWSVWGMIILPWALVFATVPHAISFFRETPAGQWWLLILFGIAFGLAQIFFGLSIAGVGIALAFAIAIGLSTAFGSIVPFLSNHADRVFTHQGFFFFCGIVLMLAGIIVSAAAGLEKERQLRMSIAASVDPQEKRMSFAAGLVLCILSGLGAPSNNFGAAFCTPTIQRAVAMGTSPTNEYNVIWAPLLTAGLVPYLIYCIYLWRKNRSFHLFAASRSGINWVFGFIMAALWMGSTAIYGVAMSRIGAMGPVLGWPLFMSIIILVSSGWGFLTGEWKGAGTKAVRFMIFAIALLIVGFCTLAYSSTLS